MKSKLNLASIIVCAVLLVMAVLVIVGVCISYINLTLSSSLLDKSTTTGYALGSDALVNADGYGVMAAFAYITLVLSLLTLIVYAVSKFVDIKVIKYVTLGVAALLVISAIVALITAFTFGGSDGGALASYTIAPAAGAWLLAIGGILGGAVGIVGTLKV